MRSRQSFPSCQVAVNAGQTPVLVASALVAQSSKIFQLGETADEGSERGFLEIFECRMQGHCYSFGNTKLLWYPVRKRTRQYIITG